MLVFFFMCPFSQPESSPGTGIFNSPQTVMIGTNSTGISLLLWLFGLFYAMAGAHVYVEYGLNVPRYIIDGVEQSVPRSGGDLNYVSTYPLIGTG